MVDASQSFTQSDCYRSSDRIAAILPKCIRCRESHRAEELYLDSRAVAVENGNGTHRTLPTTEPNTNVLMLYRPLYGTRDSPMRWYAKLSPALIRRKFFPLRNDFCVFARFRPLVGTDRGHTSEAKKAIISLTIIQVGDVLFSGKPGKLDSLKTCLRSLIHAPWGHLSEECSLTFCGAQLLLPHRRLELSQQEYYPKINPLAKSELTATNVLGVSPAVIQRRLRAFLGPCLWISQTRYDISYSIAT